MVGWLHCFEPAVRQSIMAGGHGRGKLFTSWWLGNGGQWVVVHTRQGQEILSQGLSSTPLIDKSHCEIRALMIQSFPRSPTSECCCTGDQVHTSLQWMFQIYTVIGRYTNLSQIYTQYTPIAFFEPSFKLVLSSSKVRIIIMYAVITHY